MGTKNDPGEFDCHAKALPDEPLFTLLARDALAPDIIITWARRLETQIVRGLKPESDMAKVTEAKECARAMYAWRLNNDRTKPLGTNDAENGMKP